MNKAKKLIQIIILLIVMYVIDFLIAPNIFKSQYPNDIGAVIIYYVSIIGSAAIGMIVISNNIFYWMLGDVFYCFLIFMYHPKGIYGIGLSGIMVRRYIESDVPFHILIQFILFMVIQLIISGLIQIIKVIKNKKILK
ncbi:hypothetical protein KQI77_09445 [Clostridium sp. MSJ-8]|uniref:hypothetical protein n=1 Tax=Clostridium sp. MSJ-8 TaxID=2841510 RepID=UPI001C0EEC94|nr:hypothetical protein [Clostridium sp. MSJ-8]MBU5488354.1 hypothetical protein [Clostridium sp. MSJ-8]